MKKKLLSWIMIFAMFLTLLPETAFASESPSFGFRSPGWDEETDDHIEDLSAPLEFELTSDGYGGCPVFFYFTDENGNETRLSAEDVSSSNEDIVTLWESDWIPGMFHVDFAGIGDAQINYTYNDTVYSIPVHVDLPILGFYTAPSATEKNYAPQHLVTAENNTLYVLLRDEFQDSYQITNVEFDEDFASIAELVSIDESGAFATIEITGTPWDDYYYGAYVEVIELETEEIGGEWTGLALYNGYPALKFRWSDWNDGPVENTDYVFSSNYQNAPDCGDHLFFYYTENGNETRLSAEDLVSSDEDVVIISAAEENPDCVHIQLVGLGYATIDYTLDGVTYSVPVACQLPEFGFYSEPTVSAETLITNFMVTKDQDTFYLVAKDDWTFANVELNETLQEIATITLDESGKFATIKVTGTPNSDFWYCVYFDAENAETDEYWSECAETINLENRKPSLVYRWADWQGGPVENLEEHISHRYHNAPGYTNHLFFYYKDGDTETRLSAEDLVSSDEDIVKISVAEENPDCVLVEINSFGSATIDYILDDVTYSLPVISELPEFGLYSEPEASEDTYLSKITITEDFDTFYLVATNYWTLTRVELNENLQEIATVTIDESGIFAAIKVTGTADPDRGYHINYDAVNLEYDGYIEDNGFGISIKNAKPALMFRWPDWHNGPVENTEEELRSSFNNQPGDNALFFYFVDGDNETKVSAEDLVSSDEDIVKISAHPKNEDAVLLDLVGFGRTTIQYTVDDVTYSLNVSVELPSVGLYTTTFASEETYLNSFTVTEESNVFYLVAKDYWEFTHVSLDEELSQIAELSVTEDRTVATIVITGTPENNRWYNVNYDAVNPEYGGRMNGNSQGLRLSSSKPALMYRWPDWDNGPIENTEEELKNSYHNAPGYDNALFFYFVVDGEETKLHASDLTSSDESIVKISEHPENPDAVFVEAIGFGTTTIDYKNDDVTYSLPVVLELPDIAFSTTPELSEDSYIRSFTVTEDCNTFYLVANEGCKLTHTALTGDFADIASISLDESGTYATIEITGTPENGRWYDLESTSYYAEHDSYNNFSIGIRLSSSKPALMFDREDDLITTYVNSKGTNMDFAFYLVENGSQTLVTAKDLVSGNEDILKISECPYDENLVNLVLVGWGETTLNYTAENGKTYSVKIICELPSVGYYASPVATENTFIGQEFTLTDTNNTYYLIVRDNWSIDTFAADSYLEKISDVTISPDRKVLTISITDDPEDHTWYGIELRTASSVSYYGITIIDERTSSVPPTVDVAEVFSDVNDGAWYQSAVQYVYDHNIMSGNNGLFNPTKEITRAQVVTTLYNLEGRPEVTDYRAVDEMIDVQAGAWYTDAVCWAYSVGVASGNTSTKMFNMNTPVTRQQLATFFYKYAELNGFDTETRGDYSSLLNSDKVASYAADTMKWAYGTGLITGSAVTVDGVTAYDLKPTGSATRAQMASILQRFCESNDI